MNTNKLFSLKSYEGYLSIDDRASGGQHAEFSTLTCRHCQQVLIKNPLRTRERAFCRKCNHYLCDRCGVVLAQTQVCRNIKQIIEDAQETAARSIQSTSIIIATH